MFQFSLVKKSASAFAVLAFTLCAFVFSLCGQAQYAGAATPADAELKAALQRLLKENPEIVLDVLKDNSEAVLEIAQQGSVIRKRKAMLAQWERDAQVPKKIDLTDRVFRGSQIAPVTIVAYSDFTCPYCKQAELTITQLLKKYDGKIRVTFKALPKADYPISMAAAKYGTAAFMLEGNKAWTLFDDLFSGMDQFERDGETYLKNATTKAGIDFKRLKAEAGGAKVQARLDADQKEADSLGISGTPYFLVNDLVVRGAIPKDLFEEAIEMALKLKNQ